jgi:plasmid stabilization system protein ParE
MRIKLEEDILYGLENQLEFIAKDKPKTAKKFKNELLNKLKKDLQNPFHFRKSIYSDGDETIRDYIFKGYICVYKNRREAKFNFSFRVY